MNMNKKFQTLSLLAFTAALSACQGAVDVAVSTTGTATTTPSGSGTGNTGGTISLVLSGVSPSSGPLTGGTTLTLTGTGLASGLTVQIAGSTCLNLTILSSTRATCQVPAGSTAGAQAVQAALSGQTAQLSSAYTYVAAPTVTSVTPNQGVLAGGTAIQIFGTGFKSGATVLVGASACTSVNFVSATEIDCTTPSGTGAQAIQVTNPDSQLGSLASAFTFQSSVFISSISPTSGAPAGGTTLTLHGGGFVAGALIKVNGASCTTTLDSGIQAHCTTPAASAGSYNVTITTAGQTVTASQNFHYALATAIVADADNGARACAILSDTSVNCWGIGPSEILPNTGNQSASTGNTPIAIPGISGTGLLTGVSKLSVSSEVACAVLTSGQAVCWGDNTYGQLGTGDANPHAYPVTVMNGGSPMTGVTKIVTNGAATCALLSNQQAYCWGQYENAMGVGSMGGMTLGTVILTPQVVLNSIQSAALTSITDLAMGGNTGCYVVSSSTVYCAGYANGGASPTSYVRTISNTGNVTSISVSLTSGCITTATNSNVMCWSPMSSNNYATYPNGLPTGQVFNFGAIGLSVSAATSTSYNTITYGSNPAATQISNTTDSACAVFSDGSARCIGVSGYGEFGNNVTPNYSSVSSTFTNVLNPAGSANMTNVSAVAGHCALNSSGAVYCWGVDVQSGTINGAGNGVAGTLLLPQQISWQ
jgi:hypothetical protein